MYIYVTVTRTPSVVGKMIRGVLHNEYNHMSISLNKDLSALYSFGRVSIKNFITAGFIRESYYTLSLGGASPVNLCVFRIPVTRKQYEEVRNFIRDVMYDSDGYLYNLADALGTVFRKPIRVNKCYTCIEFCKDALHYAGIKAAKNIRSERTLDGVRQKLAPYIVYEGEYKAYPGVFLTRTATDMRFMEKRGFYAEVKHTAGFVGKFAKRVYVSRLNWLTFY